MLRLFIMQALNSKSQLLRPSVARCNFAPASLSFVRPHCFVVPSSSVNLSRGLPGSVGGPCLSTTPVTSGRRDHRFLTRSMATAPAAETAVEANPLLAVRVWTKV